MSDAPAPDLDRVAMTSSGSPTASCHSKPIGVIAGSGYIVRELSLFPSRFAQKDPHPQVGPGVRIRFPPAASPRTFGSGRGLPLGMPLAAGVNYKILEDRFAQHNVAFKELDWEIEDLISEGLLAMTGCSKNRSAHQRNRRSNSLALARIWAMWRTRTLPVGVEAPPSAPMREGTAPLRHERSRPLRDASSS